MFIQVIQGKVADAAGLQRCMDRWNEELMPGAVERGFLGSTMGTTDDGTFIALARFDDADAAHANSERAEQGEWWAETAKCFDGDVIFMNCDGVQTWMAGGSDDAGFVQIMEGHSTDVGRMHELMSGHTDEVHEGRPEIIGGLLMDAGEGRWVDAIYFTSEDAARQGESLEMPADMKADMDAAMALSDGEVRFLDLHHPRMVSAKR